MAIHVLARDSGSRKLSPQVTYREEYIRFWCDHRTRCGGVLITIIDRALTITPLDDFSWGKTQVLYMPEAAINTFELTPVRGERVYVPEEETGLCVVALRIQKHPCARGHFFSKADRSITAEYNSVSLRVAECISNDVPWREVNLLVSENSVFASSPDGLSNLSVSNWVTVKR